ncbi:MAG: SDR family NAD(P)-dependent oxidoreductase [Prevotellaceae bacterium]|nr:SDR family NAD(P)-dependent oxidoreductase [Prevotellaceae bacterium]
MDKNLQNRVRNISEKRVLVAPLNWGLGHATRCVPIINALLAENKEVVLASDGHPLQFLKKEFPSLQTIEFTGINVKYSKKNSQGWAMILQMPKFAYSISKEHFILKKIVQQYNIHAVISDNRFGLWHKKIKSIYITHQIGVKVSRNIHILNKVACLVHKLFINRYSECWIPDFEGENNLSGELSHKYPLPRNCHFIGILSRFSDIRQNNSELPEYHNVGIVSGVEPHRQILADKLLSLFEKTDQPSLIISGQPTEYQKVIHKNNVTIVPHLETAKLATAIITAKQLFCRSGYSTLMDITVLGRKNACLIPTPGQTEQEYLAQKAENIGFTSLEQSKFWILDNVGKGKIAVVTGANGGFGLQIASGLAQKGTKVVLACRNEQKAMQAKQHIENAVQNADIDFISLDLSSLNSVRNFVEMYTQRYSKIDILVNNAGILFVPHKVTKDGYEQIFQTNYLGHFLLTNLLLPLFPDSYSSKIIFQSSVMYKMGKIRFYDFNLDRGYSKWKAYSQSKLALMLFALQLQRNLAQSGKKIQPVLSHPGISLETDIVKNQTIRKLAQKVCSFFSQSAQKGAQSAIVAALSNEIKSGDFIGLDGFVQGKGNPVKISISSKATDKAVAEQLWKVSCAATEFDDL